MLATILPLLLWVCLFWVPQVGKSMLCWSMSYVWTTSLSVSRLTQGRGKAAFFWQAEQYCTVSRYIPAPVFLTPFSPCLAPAQALLLLKTATSLVWILAFSLFPLQRTEESPSLSLTPGSTVLESLDYDLSPGASRSLPRHPWHSCLLGPAQGPLCPWNLPTFVMGQDTVLLVSLSQVCCSVSCTLLVPFSSSLDRKFFNLPSAGFV